MTSIWNSIGQTYNVLFDELSQPLTKDWLLIPSPLPLIAILLTYNIFCVKIGPMIMKNRQPYTLKTIIQIYNIFQVLISLYIAYEGCVYIFSGKFNFQCEGPDEMPENNVRQRVARGFYAYFITKIVELLDTVFFVLRKSERQITFLHLYHHTLMPFVSWVGVKYVPGGQAAIIGSINSIIHVFMYIYYYLSGMGPQYQKYLWWKKHLTLMQIVQFIIVLVHSTRSMYYSCSYPVVLKIVTMIESSTFIYMFSMFYYNTYILRRKGNTQAVKSETASHVSYKSTEHYVNGNFNVDSITNRTGYKDHSNGKSNGYSYTKGQCNTKQRSKHI